MGKYPDVRSAAIPAMKIVQREHGWLSPTAMEQAACVLRLTPAYLVSVASFYDMFELAPKGKTDVYVCTNISCSLLRRRRRLRADEGRDGAATRTSTCAPSSASARARSRRWRPSTASTSGPLTEDDCERIREDVKEGREVLPDKQLAKRKAASKHWRPLMIDEHRHDPLQGHRRARPQHAVTCTPARGGYEMLRKALKMEPGEVLDEMLASAACAAAAAPASRWAARCPSSPRGRWTSTSSATRTSPSPGPSRTAS